MELIPGDIQDDILIRLPLKSLLACSYVCKKLKTIICNEDFKTRYLLRSMTRPMDPTPDSLFDNVCQNENPYEEWTRSAPIRGVVFLQSTATLLLCNPITNNILRLPDFEGLTLELFSRNCIFGYDEATGVFKVLWQTICNELLVYTVRSGGEGSWRSIGYDPPYFVSFSCALCKGGVLYYAAVGFVDSKPKVICFNVNSEKFECLPLPEEVTLRDEATMVNYNGKVALVNNKSNTGVFEICVRNEVSGQWEFQLLVIPGWRDNIWSERLFSFVGTIGTGELVFTTSASWVDGSVSVLHYNTDPPQGSSRFKMYRIEADNEGSYHYVRACFNHFDCLLRAN